MVGTNNAFLFFFSGHMSDPDELPGLAHFCEHMLFLGTEKYPDENQYNKFLSDHAGRFNAFTSSDQTDYYFDVAPDHLRETLDMSVILILHLLLSLLFLISKIIICCCFLVCFFFSDFLSFL